MKKTIDPIMDEFIILTYRAVRKRKPASSISDSNHRDHIRAAPDIATRPQGCGLLLMPKKEEG